MIIPNVDDFRIRENETVLVPVFWPTDLVKGKPINETIPENIQYKTMVIRKIRLCDGSFAWDVVSVEKRG